MLRACIASVSCPSGREVDAPPGITLLDATVAAGLPIARSCGAEGVCAKCALLVVEGGDASLARSGGRDAHQDRNRIDAALRLACRARIRGDVAVTASYW